MRYLLESILSFPFLNLGECASHVEIDGYFLLGNWIKGLFPIPVGYRLCLVPQVIDSLQDWVLQVEMQLPVVIFASYRG